MEVLYTLEHIVITVTLDIRQEQTCLQDLLIDKSIKSSFVKISSEHLHSQTVKARALKFGEKVHLLFSISIMNCFFNSWKRSFHIKKFYFKPLFYTLVLKFEDYISKHQLFICINLQCHRAAKKCLFCVCMILLKYLFNVF